MRSCPERLRPIESRAYSEEGYFIREGDFGADEIAALRDAAECCAAKAGAAAAHGRTYQIDGNVYCEASGATIQFEHAAGSKTLRVIEPFHHLDARIDRLIDDPRLVEPVRGLLGEAEISLFTDKLNLKRPGEGSRFRWHQDSPYWAHFFADVERLPNAMLSIDNATRENGCLRVIPGSHRRGMLPGLQGEGRLGPLFTDPAHFDASLQVPIEVPAGSVVFFSPSLVHGSEPNDSSEERKALIFTYQPGAGRMFKVDAKRIAGR